MIEFCIPYELKNDNYSALIETIFKLLSPPTACSILIGDSANGHTAWKGNNGLFIKESKELKIVNFPSYNQL